MKENKLENLEKEVSELIKLSQQLKEINEHLLKKNIKQTKEIHKLVQDAIAAVSAEGMGDMGKLMGYLKPICEGKADMSIVSKLAKELLG